MTDRVKELVVVLDDDYRVDDVEAIVDAIKMTRGVAAVNLGKPVNMDDYTNRMRIGMEFHDRISKVLHDILHQK